MDVGPIQKNITTDTGECSVCKLEAEKNLLDIPMHKRSTISRWEAFVNEVACMQAELCFSLEVQNSKR